MFELYRGPYLEGCYLDWALSRQSRLAQDVVKACSRLASLCREAKHYDEAFMALGRVLEIDPGLESAHIMTMELQVETGKPKAALEQFLVAEKVLREEYAAEPSLELLRAYHTAKIECD